MRSLVTDPLRNFKFVVTIARPTALPGSQLNKLGFMNVDGFGVQNEVIPYREGGDNTTTRKMPGQTDFGPITLSRGMMSVPVGPQYGPGAGGGNDVYQWLSTVFSVMEGQGTAVNANADFRTNIDVALLEHPVTAGQSAAGLNLLPAIKARFYVYNAWPMAMSWSGLDAGGNAIIIESLQLAHEGFSVIYGSTTPGQYLSASPSF